MLAILVKQLERSHRDVNNHKYQVSLRYSSPAPRTYPDPAVVDTVAVEDSSIGLHIYCCLADIGELVKEDCVLVRRLPFDVGYSIS